MVDRIGDILLDVVPHFAPFVEYGAHQLYGKYEFEREKNSNPAFAQFVEVLMLFPDTYSTLIRSIRPPNVFQNLENSN